MSDALPARPRTATRLSRSQGGDAVTTGSTIFDDRETVEFLRDHPHLLAIADAVRATQTRPTSKARRPLLVAAAAVACATAAAVIAFLVVPGARTQHTGA